MALKVKLNGYTYYNPYSKYNGEYNVGDKRLNPKINFEYDDNHFQTLLANREFEAAANYASQYVFDDPETQRQHENDIENIRYQGRIIAAQYSKLDETREKPLMEFYDNVFTSGNFSRIQNNAFIKDFNDSKRKIGSTFDPDSPNKIKDEATSLAITFSPKQRTLLGVDWLTADNNNTFENFLERSGYTEKELDKKGVNIKRKDGNVIMSFDKSNPLANNIIYNLKGYDTERNHGIFGLFGVTDSPITITGINIKGEEITKTSGYNNRIKNANIVSIDNIKYLIDSGKELKDRLSKEGTALVKDYTSTVGAPLDDGLVQLNELHKNKYIDDTEYYRAYKQRTGWIEQLINVMGSADIEMYSNSFNEDEDDELLVQLSDPTQRAIAVKRINAAKPGEIHYNSMVSNGKIGVLVTIDDTKIDEKAKEKGQTLDKVVKGRRNQFFIPADNMPTLLDKCQQAINRNTSTRAAREINSMQDYGYSYKLTNGAIIDYDGKGIFYYNDMEIPGGKEEAERLINKDNIIKDASNRIKFKYMNVYGDIYDKNNYDYDAKKTAIIAAMELNPGINLTDIDGNNIEKTSTSIDELINKIWNVKGIGSSLTIPMLQNSNYNVIQKYQDIFDIYDAIMNELNYYN